MSNTIIPEKIKSSSTFANVDAKYGPYEASGGQTALQVADAALSGGVVDLRTAGLTVGIKQSDGSIKEYWYQPNQSNVLELVEKQAASVEVDSEPTEDSPNPVSSGGVYTALQEKANTSDIPSVPQISTNIETDATSDTKTASPKAVKTYVDGKVSSAYKAAGSVANVASLPALIASNIGKVCNMTSEFTTTSDFVEGSGKTYPAGTNVAVVEHTTGVYKYDVLAGFVDLSGKADKSEMIVTQGSGSDSDKTIIQLKEGTSATVLKQHQSLAGYVQVSGDCTEGHFASFTSNGSLEDSGCDEGTFIKGVKQNGTTIDPVNGVVDVTVQDGKDGTNGKSAYKIWLDENGYTSEDYSEEDFLNSLKAQIGSYVFQEYDANTGVTNIGDAVAGSGNNGQINSLAPSQDTLDKIVLMPNGSQPTATMMFSTNEVAGTPPTYQFVYIGDVNIDASTFVLKSDIDNNFVGGSGKVASADEAKTLNEGKIDKEVVISEETTYMEIAPESGYPVDKKLTPSGNEENSSYYSLGKYPVTGGNTYAVSGRSDSNPSYAFYNSSNTIIQDSIVVLTSAFNRRIVTAPTNAAYVKVVGGISSNKPKCEQVTVIVTTKDNQAIINSVGNVSELETTEKETVVGAINELANTISGIGDVSGAVQKVNAIAENVVSLNMFDKEAMVDGYIASPDGILYSGSSYKASDYIEILPNHYYYLSGRSSNKNIRCLDANKINTSPLKVLSVVGDGTLVSYVLPNDDATGSVVNGMFKTPANAAFVQFNVIFPEGDSADNVMLTDVGDTYNSDYVVPAYQPYGSATKVKPSAIDCDNVPTVNSSKPITSGGVYEALQNIEPPTPTTKKGFKVLLAGSSHGRNTITQLPWIASKAGFDVVVGNIYYGACSMQNLLGKVNANTKLNFLVFDKEGSEQTPSWHNKTENYKFDEILKYTDWDFIILQRSASDDEVWLSQAEIDQDFASYSGYLKKALDVSATPATTGGNYNGHNYALQSLLDIILANSGDKIPTILFNSSFADGTEYPTAPASGYLTVCENIMTTAEKMRKNFGLEIIPTCIALLNARTTYLNNYGCGIYNSLCYDSQHLDIGIGCYIASLTVMQVILDKLGYNIEMLPNNAYGSYAEAKALFPEADYPIERYTEPTPYNIKTAKACVLAAVNYPSARTTEVAARFTTDNREVWTITKTFNSTQVKLDNYQNFVDKGGNPYSNKVEGKTGYQIDSVTVTMGGNVIPNAYDSATGLITITQVTGDIVITVTSASA